MLNDLSSDDRITHAPVSLILQSIIVIREHTVLIDKDLAELYGVTTGNLNKAVSRNLNRFPQDFMFQLTEAEFTDLKFHFGTSSWGGTRKLPRAFTEQGVAMLSSVLRSERAIHVNIEIMRAFVQMRQMLDSDRELSRKLASLERKYDLKFKIVFDAIRELMTPVKSNKKHPVGFALPKKPNNKT